MFNIYTGVQFGQVEMDSRKGLTVGVIIDTPPGSARHEKAGTRSAYWVGAGKKRLMNGGLVALLWSVDGRVDVHVGAIAITNESLAKAAKESSRVLPIKIQFFDTSVNMKIVEYLRAKNKPRAERILVESSVMFESVSFYI